MRASTFFFLALFGAMVWSSRMRCNVLRGVHHACDALPACCDDESTCVRPQPPRPHPRVSAVEEEMRSVDQRNRDVERSLQSISQSERNLRDMVRRHPEDGVERELDAVAAGGRRLRELKARLEARKVVLQAKLEMARAGLADEVDVEPPGKESPVDALSKTEVPVRDY
jgi:hypothetical protein